MVFYYDTMYMRMELLPCGLFVLLDKLAERQACNTLSTPMLYAIDEDGL